MTISQDARKLAEDPVALFEHSHKRAHELDRAELDQLHLEALRWRFAELRNRIGVLTALADEQDVKDITTFESVVPLLLAHTVYKSYPVSLILKKKFSLLTKWLGRLTTVDLGAVPADECDSIDSWLNAFDQNTALQVTMSSGTTGAVSFLPRSTREWDRWWRQTRMTLCGAAHADGIDEPDEMYDVVWPTFRRGYTVQYRTAPWVMKHFAGSEEHFFAMSDEMVSADVLFLAGRLRAANARGEQLQIEEGDFRPRLAKFERMQHEIAHGAGAFVDRIAGKLSGRRVLSIGAPPVLVAMAQDGISKGMSGVFEPNSIITTGGGAKGATLPDDWQKLVRDFMGVDRLIDLYGMSECNGSHVLCGHGRYHIQPWVIPFVLDPDTSAPYPREGVHVGRFAFFDLTAETYWGGFVSGDEVELDWGACACGQSSPHLAQNIQRYSEMRGGDDKISCAAQPEAHAEAINFLNGELV